MNDGETGGDVDPERGREVWIEKYRPERLEDVLGHDHITDRLEGYVERNDVPHLLFAGPAGTGKCVTGETPVLTNRGIERIEDVVGDVEGFATPDPGLSVLTLESDGEFRFVRPSQVFGTRTDDLVSVRTRHGADLTVTPEHKLLVVGPDGLEWTPAADLSPGERIARPRSIPLSPPGADRGRSTVDWPSAMDGDRTVVRLSEEFASAPGVRAGERLTAPTAGTVRSTGDPGGSVVETAASGAVCSLARLRRLDVPIRELTRRVEAVQRVPDPGQCARPISPPAELTPSLATFVGVAVVGGRIEGGSITVTAADERVLERFEEAARESFDVEPRRVERDDAPATVVESAALTHYLESCFDVVGQGAGGDASGSKLVGATPEVRSAFIRAVFDAGDPGRGEGTIELELEDGSLATLLSYLLAGFAIPTRRTTRRTDTPSPGDGRGESHVLAVTGPTGLSRFHDVVGLSPSVDGPGQVEPTGAGAGTGSASEGGLCVDEVESVTRRDDEQRVYDLTVPGTRNYVAGTVPTVVHNTTTAVAIARELYGEEWRENFLELNASDQRGIDVVRERIKNFARASFGGHDYRIIFLDEADALTSEAQAALRRTMEQFSNNTRFVLSANYSSDIIDPIQSRCAIFRFSPLPEEAVEEEIRRIAEEEDIDITDDGVTALAYVADGDMRTAINRLQAAAVMGETVDEDTVFEITSSVRPEEMHELVTHALEGDFTQARSMLDDMLTEAGVAGGDIIDQIHRSVWEFDLDDDEAVRLMERVGEADYRISEGANEQVQLEALLASLALGEDRER